MIVTRVPKAYNGTLKFFKIFLTSVKINDPDLRALKYNDAASRFIARNVIVKLLMKRWLNTEVYRLPRH